MKKRKIRIIIRDILIILFIVGYYFFNKYTGLFIPCIFHELTGHMKTHINSENDSPDQAYINDFNLQLVKMDSPDSGYLFEFIMAGNFISCKYFINSSISENLLDEKLYLGDNFNELREKLQKMENVLSPMSVTKKPNNEKKSKDINEIP